MGFGLKSGSTQSLKPGPARVSVSTVMNRVGSVQAYNWVGLGSGMDRILGATKVRAECDELIRVEMIQTI